MLPSSRASSIPRELACPGSPAVLARVGVRKGDDGDVGTYLHTLVAQRMVDEMWAVPPDGGVPVPELSSTFIPPKHDLWIVDWCLRFAHETIPDNYSLMVEVEMEHEFDRWKLTGHADWLAINGEITELIGADWKTVYVGVPPAELNDQILSYIVLAKLTWPSLRKVTFYIVQPRISEEDGDGESQRVSRVTMEGDELDACVASLDARKCAALDDWRRLSSGPQCKWCVGLKCPNLQKELSNMETQLTDELLASLKAEPDDQKIAELFLSARTLRKPLEDFDDIVNERLTRGALNCPDGRRITAKVQNAGIKVLDPVAFYMQLKEVVPDDEKRAQCVNFVMGRTIDVIAELTGAPKGGKSGTSARDQFLARFSPFFEMRTKMTKEVSL